MSIFSTAALTDSIAKNTEKLTSVMESLKEVTLQAALGDEAAAKRMDELTTQELVIKRQIEAAKENLPAASEAEARAFAIKGCQAAMDATKIELKKYAAEAKALVKSIPDAIREGEAYRDRIADLIAAGVEVEPKTFHAPGLERVIRERADQLTEMSKADPAAIEARKTKMACNAAEYAYTLVHGNPVTKPSFAQMREAFDHTDDKSALGIIRATKYHDEHDLARVMNAFFNDGWHPDPHHEPAETAA